MNELSTCCTCGHSWPTGQDGRHSCALVLQRRLKEAESPTHVEVTPGNFLPLSITFTKERLQADAKAYLTRLYGKPNESGDADKWMERFGLLCGFIDEQFKDPYERLSRQLERDRYAD